jgi:hypothetical protein
LPDSRLDIESLPFPFSGVVSASVGCNVSNRFHAASNWFSGPSPSSLDASEHPVEFTSTATGVEAEAGSRSGSWIAIGAGIAALILIGIISVVGFIFLHRCTCGSQSYEISEEEEARTTIVSFTQLTHELLDFMSTENMLATDRLADLVGFHGQSDQE